MERRGTAEMVTVRFYAAAREAAGTASELVDAESVTALRRALIAAHGDRMEQVLAVSTLMSDGARLGPHAALPPGATVEVLPPFAGG